MGVGGQRDNPAALPPAIRPGTHCTGGRVGQGPVWKGAENLAPILDIIGLYKYHALTQPWIKNTVSRQLKFKNRVRTYEYIHKFSSSV